MTDIYAVLDKVRDTIAGWAAESAAAPQLPSMAQNLDPRREVDQWPPAARYINYPSPVADNVLGATMGPMLPPDGVKDPIFYTAVEVDGHRVGLAYGLFKLKATA